MRQEWSSDPGSCRAQASSGIVAHEYSCSICQGSLRVQKMAKVEDGRCSFNLYYAQTLPNVYQARTPLKSR